MTMTMTINSISLMALIVISAFGFVFNIGKPNRTRQVIYHAVMLILLVLLKG